MSRIWTPVQATPHPSNVSGLSFIGEQVLQVLQKKWQDSYSSLTNVTTTPAHYILSTREGGAFEEPTPACRIPVVSEPITDLCTLREGFSQLNKPSEFSVFGHCTPMGLMLALTVQPGYTDFCYFSVSDNHWKNKNTPQTFISLLLNGRCRKLCYDAQELIMFLVDKYGFEADQVCLKWLLLDPKVGCWLLDPDHPPGQFADAVHALSLGLEKPSASPNMKTVACHQLQLLSSLTEKLYQQLLKQKLWKIFVDMEMKLLPILAVMELRGILVNKERLKEMENVLENQMNRLKDAAYRAAGKHFHMNSVPQLSQILYEHLKLDQKAGIKVKTTMSRGSKSTSIPMLKLLQPFHPLPGIVLEYRHLHKLNSTYVAGMLQHTKGDYIFTTWEQTACATGRLTSSNPNLQSVPKQPISIAGQTDEQRSILLRSPFIPRPGHVLLAADFQHIEFRIFAHLAKDVALIQLFHKPNDIFVNLAQMWLNRGSAVITAEDREKTKRIVYAMMYGAGAQKLAEILDVKGDEANFIISSFNSIFPGLHTFRQHVIDECQKQGYLCTVGGRRRLFPSICSSSFIVRAHTERQAVNFVIQGSAADLCKSAMLQIEHKLQEEQLAHDAHLLLQIHDELVWEVSIAQLQNVRGIVKTVMEQSKSLFGLSEKFSVPLPVLISTGETWADMTP
ncbi:hypothetical protein B7P43_G14844 [Cryptotermes secundus]|uniref:DNA-directed DNA polymerase family A palm domain-containing protein n=1 Tax=Cryptotermes secundus TaxID=105785 RepID=A0A2J7Q1Q5_9NEOP|nr:hypothetical protein B7P43_G14844 [Cryptotermes secundus]